MRLVAATASVLLLASPAWAAQTAAPQPATPAPVVLDLGQLDQVTAGNSAPQKYRPQFYLRPPVVPVSGKLFVGGLSLSWDTSALPSYLEYRLTNVQVTSYQVGGGG